MSRKSVFVLNEERWRRIIRRSLESYYRGSWFLRDVFESGWYYPKGAIRVGSWGEWLNKEGDSFGGIPPEDIDVGIMIGFEF